MEKKSPYTFQLGQPTTDWCYTACEPYTTYLNGISIGTLFSGKNWCCRRCRLACGYIRYTHCCWHRKWYYTRRSNSLFWANFVIPLQRTVFKIEIITVLLGWFVYNQLFWWIDSKSSQDDSDSEWDGWILLNLISNFDFNLPGPTLSPPAHFYFY